MTVDTQEIVCTGKRHGSSQNAWRLGCRHPGAIAAHEKWKADHKPFTLRPPAVDDDGNCIAPKHGSAVAYIMGCRCPGTIAIWDQRQERRKEESRDRRDRAYMRIFSAEARTAMRRTGGRLPSDPRRRWRGGKMAVRRWQLFWAVRGEFVAESTMAELMVAVIRNEVKIVPDSPWCSRPINDIELAARLGIDDRRVYRLRQTRERLRRQRTERRLADAKWRAAVVAAAIERRAFAARSMGVQ